ncbi:hypothetical protein GN956_G12391 [Arapaima gigas]
MEHLQEAGKTLSSQAFLKYKMPKAPGMKSIEIFYPIDYAQQQQLFARYGYMPPTLPQQNQNPFPSFTVPQAGVQELPQPLPPAQGVQSGPKATPLEPKMLPTFSCQVRVGRRNGAPLDG